MAAQLRRADQSAVPRFFALPECTTTFRQTIIGVIPDVRERASRGARTETRRRLDSVLATA
jgi:hypothetical protein